MAEPLGYGYNLGVVVGFVKYNIAGAPVPAQRDLPSMIRHAIRAARKIRIAYQDGDRRSTGRVIQPFATAWINSDPPG
jgi:hypothetical protein